MSELFDGAVGVSTAIQATMVLLVGLGAVRLFRRASASMRHAIVAATFVGLLILPLGLALTPPLVVFETPVMEVSAPAASVAASAHETSSSAGAANAQSHAAIRDGGAHWRTWTTLAQLAWAVGALIILLRLGGAVLRLTRIRRAAIPWIAGRALVGVLGADTGGRRPVDILLHEEIAAPFTVGLTAPAVVLPMDARDWPEADLRRALIHELEHVRRGDWAVHLIARIAFALHWCNPLAWIALQRLSLEAERACDDAVVTRGGGAEYAEQLVALAQRVKKNAAPYTALAMARRSDLSARVSAILDSKQPRASPGIAAAVFTLAAMFIAVMSIASVRAEPASPNADASARRSVPQTSGAADARPRPSAVDRALYQAAEDGDLDSISRLVDAGANVDATIPRDGSPLIGAARRGRVAAVRLLLDRGADPNKSVRGDGNPLITAAREGEIAVVALLLEHGANVNEAAPDDENALIQASGRGQLAVVELLVAHGAEVNARLWAAQRGGAGEWRTALSVARRAGHAEVASFLVSVGARD